MGTKLNAVDNYSDKVLTNNKPAFKLLTLPMPLELTPPLPLPLPLLTPLGSLNSEKAEVEVESWTKNIIVV